MATKYPPVPNPYIESQMLITRAENFDWWRWHFAGQIAAGLDQTAHAPVDAADECEFRAEMMIESLLREDESDE